MSNSQQQANEMHQAFPDRQNISISFDMWVEQEKMAGQSWFTDSDMISFARFHSDRVKGTSTIPLNCQAVELMREGGAI